MSEESKRSAAQAGKACFIEGLDPAVEAEQFSAEDQVVFWAAFKAEQARQLEELNKRNLRQPFFRWEDPLM